jgi:D-glycero-D-manno-heptose 1,7-bisphosphate phosphatase
LRRAVFLDRDGTIAEDMGYVNHIERFRMLPGSGIAIRKLNEAGFAVIMITNQSGVARGYFPESLVGEVHQKMLRELAEVGAAMDGIYYCPHGAGDGCDCRKPNLGMVVQAAREHELDLQRSFVVGDRYGDVETAFRAGARGVLVKTGYGLGEWTWHAQKWPRQPDLVAKDLPEAVDWILRQA